MLEEYGDLWALPADARCITTNGSLRVGGLAVMGRGCAQEALERWPCLAILLGRLIRERGIGVYFLYRDAKLGYLINFPVKYDWRQAANMLLIEHSCKELMALIDRRQFQRVLLPRPGCGAGGLQWEDVRSVIAPLLDNRVAVLCHAREADKV